MQSDRRTIPFLSFSPNHSPTLAQSTNLNPPTPTTYSFRPDSQQPPYYSPRYPTDTTSQHTADGQPQGMYYRYPAETSQSAPVGYPESSQRTMLHDGPFPDDYDLSVGSSELGVVTRRERLGNSGEHRLFLRRRSTPQMADQMTLNSSTGLYCLMPIPSDEQSLPNRRRTYTTDRQPVENNSFYHDEISTDIDSLQFENDDSPTLPTPTPLPSLAHENSPDLNPMILTFQMHPNYQGDRDNPETQSFVFLSGDLNEDSRKLYEPKDDPDYILNLAMQSQPPSPIPMRNSSGWSQPSLSSALDAHADLATEQSNSPARTTPESESSASIHHSGLYSNSNPDTQCSSSTPPTSSSSNPSKKKKSKMHQCELCPKKFPRPSGLRTHMNTHNNVKPFPCGFPSCPRTFAVRSNAKRHLRTHGVVPSSVVDSAPTPYVVGFSAPLVLPQSPQHHQMSRAPFKLRWMPHSLSTRTNAATLRSSSDPDSESNDGDYDDDNACASPVLSMPLHPVSPSSPTVDSDDQYEERDSHLETGSHPYHPSQFRVLPGPVAGMPRTLVAL